MLRHIRSFVAAVLLSFATIDAVALEYTDAWVPLGEDGSGVFLVQSEAFVFLAFLRLRPELTSRYGIRASSFAMRMASRTAAACTHRREPTTRCRGIQPRHTPTAIGTCTFAPADIYTATLTYTLTGAPPIVKTIRRYALLPYNLAGNYSGSMAGFDQRMQRSRGQRRCVPCPVRARGSAGR
jgi:hypothetical protein